MGEDGAGDSASDGYREKYSVYAARYGNSARSVKRWVAAGKAAQDLCPLDDAAALAEWWVRNMRNKVPDAILREASKSRPLLELPVVVKAAAVKAEKPVVPAEIEETEVEFTISDDELGLEKTLDRLSRMEVRLSKEAHKPGQTTAWLNTVARMGTVAEKLRVEAERLGKLLPKAMVEEIIHAFHGPIEREFRLMYETMCELLGLPPSPDRKALWDGECDRLFVKFREGVLK